jgi:hypothetical protein
MARRVRNPGSGKPPHNGPASGIPASGQPASGIEAHGPGWGGPAQGAGRGNKRAAPITPENSAALAELRDTPEAKQRRYDRIAAQDEIHGFYTSVFKDEDESMLYRLTAARHLEQGRYSAVSGDDPSAGKLIIHGGLPDGDPHQPSNAASEAGGDLPGPGAV